MRTVSCLFGKDASQAPSTKMRHHAGTPKKELANKCGVWYTFGVNRDVCYHPTAVFFP